MYIPIADAIPLMYVEFQLSVFGELANNSILFDEVQCRGDENSLIECQHEGIGSHECFSFAAGVICTGDSISLCRGGLCFHRLLLQVSSTAMAIF